MFVENLNKIFNSQAGVGKMCKEMLIKEREERRSNEIIIIIYSSP